MLTKMVTFEISPYNKPISFTLLFEESDNGPQLSIGGPESWTALVLREDGILDKTNADGNNTKGNKGDSKQLKRKGKGKKPKITAGPKVFKNL